VPLNLLVEFKRGLILFNLADSRVVQMAERGKCYIYGSMHIKMPRKDILRELLSKVDYVLLEGFNVGDWRSLIRRKPSVTLIVLGVLTYFTILDLHVRVIDKWYRLRGKPPFRGGHGIRERLRSEAGQEGRGGRCQFRRGVFRAISKPQAHTTKMQ
jgi:hypothetical protein